jgi:hypothetical protein
MTTQTELPDDYLRADDQYSMPTIIGMWVEDFESYTQNMTREEFDSTIADTKWLLELLRKARKEAPKESDWRDSQASEVLEVEEMEPAR